MRHLLCTQNLIKLTARRRLERPTPALEIGIFRRRTDIRRVTERVSIIKEHGAEFCLANSRRIFQHRVKDRFQLAWEKN